MSPLGTPRLAPQQCAVMDAKDRRYESGSVPPFASHSTPAGAESREVGRGSPPVTTMRPTDDSVKTAAARGMQRPNRACVRLTPPAVTPSSRDDAQSRRSCAFVRPRDGADAAHHHAPTPDRTPSVGDPRRDADADRRRDGVRVAPSPDGHRGTLRQRHRVGHRSHHGPARDLHVDPPEWGGALRRLRGGHPRRIPPLRRSRRGAIALPRHPGRRLVGARRVLPRFRDGRAADHSLHRAARRPQPGRARLRHVRRLHPARGHGARARSRRTGDVGARHAGARDSGPSSGGVPALRPGLRRARPRPGHRGGAPASAPRLRVRAVPRRRSLSRDLRHGARAARELSRVQRDEP